ncbi:uncharacterized protein LOC108882047 [Lates calcarifer]|uniref:Uncharacterized protein LOC108882047 n=1 Tax=Lates calcarifer TaxID=8187 RepID=A0AAJ8BFE8_LATCA|nr:uncharacterized protein LOC108882047 [Lates calcarifer]XP_050931522.1 uncharacterized protein LOC108882047 [Lates calcarifer]
MSLSLFNFDLFKYHKRGFRQIHLQTDCGDTIYNSGQGIGTVITVKTRGSTGDNTADGGSSPGGHHIPMIAAVAVVATLLLISLTCFCTLRWKQAQAARVIYEVPHIDSEVAEMDKHSTNSSTGSTEWCQVPVYESCDYFERVQTKESR